MTLPALHARLGRWRGWLLALWLIVPVRTLEPARRDSGEKAVWVVSNGFHTSLGFRREDVPFAAELTTVPTAPGLLIGWGALEFYQGKTNAWTTLKAIFPGPSALHVVPVGGEIAEHFPHSDIVRLHLSAADFARLMAGLRAAFHRDADGRPVDIGPGYSGHSRFFAGDERFYFPKMCNVWVASRLRESGVPIFVPGAIMASDLVQQAATIGERQGSRSKPSDVF